MEWIKVSERLPLVPCFVICYKTTRPHVLGLYFDSNKDFRWAESLHTDTVTHWMELPPPPTESVKEDLINYNFGPDNQD